MTQISLNLDLSFLFFFNRVGKLKQQNGQHEIETNQIWFLKDF
jgi:hypothetical protein